MDWAEEAAFSQLDLNPLRRAILHSCAGMLDGEPIPLFLLRETLHPDHRAKLPAAVEALVTQGLLAKASTGFPSIPAVCFTPFARRFLGSAPRSLAVQAAIKAALAKCLNQFKTPTLAHHPADLAELRKVELLEPHLRFIATTALSEYELKLKLEKTLAETDTAVLSEGVEVALLLTLLAESLAILGHSGQAHSYLTQAQKLAAQVLPPQP